MSSVSNNLFDCCFRHDLSSSLKGESSSETTAKTLGSLLTKAERDVIDAYTPEAGKEIDWGKAKAAELKYQSVTRSFESFSKIMQNRFQTMMERIRALNVR